MKFHFRFFLASGAVIFLLVFAACQPQKEVKEETKKATLVAEERDPLLDALVDNSPLGPSEADVRQVVNGLVPGTIVEISNLGNIGRNPANEVSHVLVCNNGALTEVVIKPWKVPGEVFYIPKILSERGLGQRKPCLKSKMGKLP